MSERASVAASKDGPVAGHVVFVELIGLAHHRHTDQVGWHISSQALATDSDPDSAAWSLVQELDSRANVCHSTSWRWEAGRGLVLTYATLDTREDLNGCIVLTQPAIVASDDATRPRPPIVHAHHVVAHAVTHLADLARRDPTVRALAEAPEQRAAWSAIEALARRTPTATHSLAHQLASTQGSSVRGSVRPR